MPQSHSATLDRLDTAELITVGIDPDTYRRRWRVLTTLCGSLLVVMLANTSTNLALPKMSIDLRLTTLQQTWVIEVYSLVFAGLLFLAAAVGDRYGRRLVMQAGLGLFLFASLYAAFIASTGVEVIGMRALAGIGAAMVMPTTLSIINVSFPPHERARAIAIWSAVAGLGLGAGMAISGFLLQYFAWQSVFGFGAAVGALVMGSNHFWIKESRDDLKTPVDWLGGVLSTIGLSALVYAVLEASHGASARVWVAAATGTLCMAGFAWWQSRTDHPLLDPRLFADPAFTVSMVTLVLSFLALSGMFFASSQMLQLILGYGPLKSALVIIPMVAIQLLIAPMVPPVVDRVGVRWPVAVGMALVSIGFAFMWRWPTHPDYWQVFGCVVILIVGMTFAMIPATDMMMAAVPRNRSGMGSAMNDTTRELGTALGVALLGSLLSAGYARRISPVADALAPDAADAVRTSLNGAVDAAGRIGSAGPDLVTRATQAWMDALTSGLGASALVCGLCAVLAAVWMPDHEPEPREH